MFKVLRFQWAPTLFTLFRKGEDCIPYSYLVQKSSFRFADKSGLGVASKVKLEEGYGKVTIVVETAFVREERLCIARLSLSNLYVYLKLLYVVSSLFVPYDRRSDARLRRKACVSPSSLY